MKTCKDSSWKDRADHKGGFKEIRSFKLYNIEVANWRLRENPTARTH